MMYVLVKVLQPAFLALYLTTAGPKARLLGAQMQRETRTNYFPNHTIYDTHDEECLPPYD